MFKYHFLRASGSPLPNSKGARGVQKREKIEFYRAFKRSVDYLSTEYFYKYSTCHFPGATTIV